MYLHCHFLSTVTLVQLPNTGVKTLPENRRQYMYLHCHFLSNFTLVQLPNTGVKTLV